MESLELRAGQAPPPVLPSKTLFTPWANDLQQFFEQFKCASPLFPRFKAGAICVSNNATFFDALRILIYNRLLSAPVLDATSNAIIGMFSMRAVLNLIVNNFTEAQLSTMKEANFEAALNERALGTKKLSELQNLGNLDPVYLVSTDDSLRRALEIMVQTKTHRVVVVDEKEVPLALVTQSRLVALLGTMMDRIPSADKTIEELRLGFKKVFYVPQDVTTLTAFRYMKDQDVNGIAVVDKESGKLVGNLSIHDLKLLGYSYDYWSLLALPVMDYLQKVPEVAESLNLRTHFKSLTETVVVRPSDTFSAVISKLYMYRIHRVYIVDEKSMPIGVISLHDVLLHIWELFFSEAAQ